MSQTTMSFSGSRGGSRGGRAGQSRPAGKEVRALVWLARHPVWALIPASIALGMVKVGPIVTGYGVAGVAGVVVAWWRTHPDSFHRWAAPSLRSFKRRWHDYRGARWADVLADCELTRSNGTTGQNVVPRLLRVRAVTPSIDVLSVRMARGQDVRVWTDRAEALADALRAHRVAVGRQRPGRLRIVVEREMPFAYALPAPDIPGEPVDVDLGALDLGDDEFGQPVTVSVINGSHHLVVGATGAGKGSAMWGTLRQLGPMIRDGWVRVWMIDLKGGQETEIGAPLFHRRAITMADAVELIGEFRDQMKTDQERLRTDGVRKAVIGPDHPLDLLMIDELAMLTAYGDRSMVRKAINLLSEVMTQARSTGKCVAGYIQEPAKDVLEIRELFTTRICLGVTAASHVDMALGDGARDRGALADDIPLDEDHAGIGFRMDRGTRLPRRIRLGYSSDTDITELVQRCTPGPHLSVVPDDTDGGSDSGEGVA